MTTSLKEETITPKQAMEMLQTSYGNRPINQQSVLEYAVQMTQGKWSSTASKLVFDDKDHLIDGHHRLHACIMSVKSFTTLVQRGVPTSDRDIIDTGKKRTLQDLFGMYTKRKYVNNYSAALNQCANLVTRNKFKRPRIQTLESARKWGALFEEGLEYVVEIVNSQGTKNGNYLSIFRNGYISGPFAFAYKRNPSKTREFMKQVMHGEGISSKDPAFTLRNTLLNMLRGERRIAGGGTAPDISYKILSALYCYIHNEPYTKSQVSTQAYEYFLEAYDTAQVKNLMAPYLELTVEKEKLMKKLEEAAKVK